MGNPISKVILIAAKKEVARKLQSFLSDMESDGHEVERRKDIGGGSIIYNLSHSFRAICYRPARWAFIEVSWGDQTDVVIPEGHTFSSSFITRVFTKGGQNA